MKRKHATGAVRNSRIGKGRYDLLPPAAMHELAQHFELGGLRMGDRNWERGMPLSWFLDSALRHAFQVSAGATDENHAIAVAWNMLCFAETRARIKAGKLPSTLDDLPRP